MHRILIIEDERAIRQALVRLLQKQDFEVSEAVSVEDAVAAQAVDREGW